MEYPIPLQLGSHLIHGYQDIMRIMIGKYGEDPVETISVFEEGQDPFINLMTAFIGSGIYVFPDGKNIYQELVRTIGYKSSKKVKREFDYHMRVEMARSFACSVPTGAVLLRLKDMGPIIEIGCGSGYWARCLRELGATIYPYDKRDPNKPKEEQHDHKYAHVTHTDIIIQDGAGGVVRHQDANTLLLCWPEPMVAPTYSAMEGESNDKALRRALMVPNNINTAALKGIRTFKGENLVFVGEPTDKFGSPLFFEEMANRFKIVDKKKDVLPMHPFCWEDNAIFLKRR